MKKRLIKLRHLPLNRGQIFHIAIGPKLANWPKLISKKKSGIPQITKKSKYGTKKAPGI